MTGGDECPAGTCQYGSLDHCQTIGGCLVVRVGPSRSPHPGPVPARVPAVNRNLVEERNALRELVDLLWGELDVPTVLELERRNPEVVEACKRNHELVAHGE